MKDKQRISIPYREGVLDSDYRIQRIVESTGYSSVDVRRVIKMYDRMIEDEVARGYNVDIGLLMITNEVLAPKRGVPNSKYYINKSNDAGRSFKDAGDPKVYMLGFRKRRLKVSARRKLRKRIYLFDRMMLIRTLAEDLDFVKKLAKDRDKYQYYIPDVEKEDKANYERQVAEYMSDED